VAVVVGFFAVALVLVVIGAQRSLQPPPPVASLAPGVPGSPRSVTVIMRDYAFDPTPLVLVAGETVRLTVFNAGLAPHELVLGDASVQAAWARADAAATPSAPFQTAPPASVPPAAGGLRVLVPSGEQRVVDFVVPTGGELLLQCHLPGHLEHGMAGRVELRQAPVSPPPTR
jgi:uncharacterized cupredoxin-like copper-binding protein